MRAKTKAKKRPIPPARQKPAKKRAAPRKDIDALLGRIQRKGEKRIDEFVRGVKAPFAGMVAQAVTELEELDASLGDDEEE
jgi:hypothetical protein